MGPVYNHKPVHHIQAVAKSSHFLLHNLISGYQQGPLVTLKINLALHNLLARASLPSSMSAPNTTICLPGLASPPLSLPQTPLCPSLPLPPPHPYPFPLLQSPLAAKKINGKLITGAFKILKTSSDKMAGMLQQFSLAVN